jgi:hypothetical protein
MIDFPVETQARQDRSGSIEWSTSAVADRIDVTRNASQARMSERQLDMGYSLYLVKARDCLDAQNRFTETEWNAFLRETSGSG